MAWKKIDDSKLIAIANTIRNQLNVTRSISLDEMPNLIMNITTGISSVPNYWAKYLVAKETAINSALDTAGTNRSAFLWYTDAHWTTNYGSSPRILKHLNDHTDMEKTFFGGDIATAKSGEINALTIWKNEVKNIPNHHCILGNHDNQVTELTTNSDISDFFLGYENTSNMVFGTSNSDGKLYYYIDNNTEKTRYICLSTGRMWTSVDEVIWCINTLNSTPEGWHIVVISHIWLNSDYTNGATLITTPVEYAQVYLDLFDAYNHREKGNAIMHNSAYNFKNGKAKVEFIVGGHIHQDYDFTSTRGIPVILTECDSYQERDDISVAVSGTTSESCIYAIIADYNEKTVKIINIGRGDTRNLQIPDVNIEIDPDEDEITYTNWVKNAYSGPDMTIYNNGQGYKDDVRINTEGNETTSDASGWDSTGYIPAQRGSIVRFKNCSVYDMTEANGTTSRMSFKFYDESFALVTQSDAFKPTNHPSSAWEPVHGDDGDLIQVKLPTSYPSSTRYIRITLDDIDDSSIITVDEEIDGDSNGDSGDIIVPDIPSGNYTNVLTSAGYTTNTRISVSSGSFENKTESGWCASGLIPAVAGDVIRLYNCTFTKSNPAGGTHRGGIYGANADGTYSGQMVSMSDLTKSGSSANPVYDTDDDNIIQFTVPSSIKSPGYIRIVVQNFNEYSIITVNQSMD